MKHYLFLLFIIGTCLLSSCEEVVYTPKPRAFPKVEYPEGTYLSFDRDYCNFSFQYPDYAKIEQDTSFFGEKPKNPCWFDMNIAALSSQLHFTYYPIESREDFDQLRDDAYRLANEHNKKADYIDELPIKKESVSGVVFDIEGEVASPFQFYLTDSTNHFLRGALYFNAQARPDSLAPVHDFMKKEVLKMIDSFEWTTK